MSVAKIKVPNFVGMASKSFQNKAAISIALSLFVVAILTVLFLRFRKLDFSFIGDWNPLTDTKKARESYERLEDATKSTTRRWNLSVSMNELDMRYVALVNAMNRWGVDQDSIVRNLKGLNKDDILYLRDKFGIKLYSDGVIASYAWQEKYWSKPLDMNGWIKEKLSGWRYKDELQAVKDIFSNAGLVL